MFGLMRNFYKWCKTRKEKVVTAALLGIDNAGKSTVLACMKGEYQEFIAPTVGFSSEVIKQGAHTIKVFDLGGGVNIRGIWPRYYAELHGAVFVVDSSDKSKLPAAREVLHQALEHPRFANKPLLVMANKQDKTEPMSSAEIASNLGLEKFKGLQFHVTMCTALMEEGVAPDPRIAQGLKWLTNAIDSNYNALQKRIQKDSEEQKEEERIEREEKRKRVEARKRERELEREQQEKEEKEKGKMHTIVAVQDPSADNTISVITEVPSSSRSIGKHEQVVKSESHKSISKNAVAPSTEPDEVHGSKSAHKTPRTPRGSSVYASSTIVVARQPEEVPTTEDHSALSRSKSPDAFTVQVHGQEDASVPTGTSKSTSSLPPLSSRAKLDTVPSPSLQTFHPLPPLEKPAFV